MNQEIVQDPTKGEINQDKQIVHNRAHGGGVGIDK